MPAGTPDPGGPGDSGGPGGLGGLGEPAAPREPGGSGRAGGSGGPARAGDRRDPRDQHASRDPRTPRDQHTPRDPRGAPPPAVRRRRHGPVAAPPPAIPRAVRSLRVLLILQAVLFALLAAMWLVAAQSVPILALVVASPLAVLAALGGMLAHRLYARVGRVGLFLYQAGATAIAAGAFAFGGMPVFFVGIAMWVLLLRRDTARFLWRDARRAFGDEPWEAAFDHRGPGPG